jgi:hypothetical protein
VRASWALLAALTVTGCSAPAPKPSTAATPEPTTKAVPELGAVLDREMVTFDGPAPPPDLVEWLAGQRVALIGEEHGIVEHDALLVALAAQLQQRGTRALLLEGAQSESWLTDRYARGLTDSLPPLAEKYMHRAIDGIRALNAGLPAADRVHVHQIDIDHRDWAFPQALWLMREQGVKHPAVDAFLASLDVDWTTPDARETHSTRRANDPETYRGALGVLEKALSEDASHPQRELLRRMTRWARESLAIRDVWDTRGEDEAHPMREEVIKQLVERQLDAYAGATGPVLLNMGGYHAQLKHVMGTPKVWVGQYLEEKSPRAKGATANVYTAVARRLQEGELVFSVLEDPVPGELFAAMATRAGEKNAFLRLDDPYFADEVLPVSYSGHVVRHAPRQVFDAYVLLARGEKRR